ncbi:MAG: LysR family transcriptional regulator [Parvibaculum sp.]
MISLLHARSLLAVLDEGGIRAAARFLELSPSTVIDHVQQLERDLGAQLVSRRRGGVEPTGKGSVFLPLARALLATAERAYEIVREAPLSVSASTNVGTYLLHGVLASYHSIARSRPALWIGPNPAVAERLKTGAADVAVMEWWDDRPGFQATHWRREPLVLIVSPSHPWAHTAAIVPDDLAREPMLGGEPATGTGRVLRAAMPDVVPRLRLVDGYGSTEAVKRAVRAGLGISLVLAASVVDEVASGTLVAVPVEGVDLFKDAYIVHPAGLPSSSEVRRFVEHALHSAG